MKQYLQLLQDIKDKGSYKEDRTGVGTYSIFGYQMRFNLSDGFPLLTTKKLHWKSIVHELLWFMKGDTNVKYLQDNGVRIWNEWADEEGNFGPIYGKQWRAWETNDGNVIDQLANVIDEIKTNTNSRRLIVSAWNVGDIDKMVLPPCHLLFQFYVKDGKLSLQLYQRSGDAFLGIPFNIASYSLLLAIVAKECNLECGEFIHTIGDAHIYSNHMEQVDEQLSREVRELPRLVIADGKKWDEYKYEDFIIEGYNPHPHIKGIVAV